MYHNILGGYLAFIFPLTLYFGIYRKSILSLVAAVIIAVGVVITSTRIGLGITILMFLITAIILIFEQRKKDLFKVGLVGIIAVMSVWADSSSGGQEDMMWPVRSQLSYKRLKQYLPIFLP